MEATRRGSGERDRNFLESGDKVGNLNRFFAKIVEIMVFQH